VKFQMNMMWRHRIDSFVFALFFIISVTTVKKAGNSCTTRHYKQNLQNKM